MIDLLLTLGHNSSAIVVVHGQIVAGYETERLSGVKSDSNFPTMVLQQLDIPKFDRVFVSHWEPTANLANMSKKHWQPDQLQYEELHTLGEDFTHHDAHAYSAKWFAGSDFPTDHAFVFVVDGFGNYGEHISIYKINVDHSLTLINRYFGYDGSLGLLYQYATAFLGMKMHEDEYKILGYEAHLPEVPYNEQEFDRLLLRWSTKYMNALTRNSFEGSRSSFDPLIDLGALVNVQVRISEMLQEVCKEQEIHDPMGWRGRVIISAFVQTLLETVFKTLLNIYRPVNLIVAGGVFYNVKLNMCAVQQVPGKVCVMPLAGDQGAALGLYHGLGNSLDDCSNLFWGHRTISKPTDTVPGLEFVTESQATERILTQLKDVGYVNIVRGSMEFGPRALCNTSTLARADNPQIVNEINRINGRNTIMPFAPVVSRATYQELFLHTNKVWKSEEYMITALPYNGHWASTYPGASHYYPQEDLWTGRPQVISAQDTLMTTVLAEHPLLINTSFNIHGQPIVFELDEILTAHRYQYAKNPNTVTLIIGD